MTTPEEILAYIEYGKCRTDETAPARLYDAIDRLLESNPYYYLQFWSNTTEFIRAKLTRANAVPTTDDTEKDITITVRNGNTGDSPIQ